MGRFRDLTKEKFGRLTPEYRIPHTRKYHCKCDCGNECDVLHDNLVSGRQVSCGCVNMDNRHNRHKDLSGATINGIELVRQSETENAPSGKKFIHYLCICPFCGNLFDSRLANIKSGNTKGCGCTRYQYMHHIDLTNRDFEFCHVEERVENQTSPSGNTKVMYRCTCCCGKEYVDWAHTIMHGRSNCGCQKIQSKGEVLIKNYLDNSNIIYTTQYWFDELRGKKNAPYFFDFAIYDINMNLLCLIEYQGEQHFHETHKSIKDFGKTQREVSDPAKRKYCKTHNIKLFEITYNENVEVKCKEILNSLYHDNTVPSL